MDGWGDDYDIRVGRSRTVTGPYTDTLGRDLKEASMGLKIAGSYQFRASAPNVRDTGNGWKWGGIRGPGHGVPFYDPVSGRYFFVHHFRDGAAINRVYDKKEDRASYKIHYMMIRPMFFLNDWPLLGPEPYQGEEYEPLSPCEVQGRREIVIFKESDNRMQTGQEETADDRTGYPDNCIVYRCPDFENGGAAAAVTGFTDSGLAYWGKFMYSNIV